MKLPKLTLNIMKAKDEDDVEKHGGIHALISIMVVATYIHSL